MNKAGEITSESTKPVGCDRAARPVGILLVGKRDAMVAPGGGEVQMQALADALSAAADGGLCRGPEGDRPVTRHRVNSSRPGRLGEATHRPYAEPASA